MGLARRPRRTSYRATPARHGTEYAQPPPTRGSRQPPRPAKCDPGLTATRQQPRKARIPLPTMKGTVALGDPYTASIVSRVLRVQMVRARSSKVLRSLW
jgi:hypothetical protein